MRKGAENRPERDRPVSYTHLDVYKRQVFACVMADHPEIFYVDGYTLTTHALGEDIQDVSFQAEYTFTRQQAQERLLRVEEKADAVLSTLTEDMDDYEKLKTLYESIVTGTEYRCV